MTQDMSEIVVLHKEQKQARLTDLYVSGTTYTSPHKNMLYPYNIICDATRAPRNCSVEPGNARINAVMLRCPHYFSSSQPLGRGHNRSITALMRNLKHLKTKTPVLNPPVRSLAVR